MTLHDEILTAVADTIDEYGQDYVFLEEAIADAVFKRIRDTVGSTQEKLQTSLEQERAVRNAAELRAETLENEVANLLQGKVSQ